MAMLSLGSVYAQIGGAYISKQAVGGTFAKSASLRLYIQASSPDGGYVTYQWWRTQDTVPQAVVNSYASPLSNANILDIKTNYNAVSIDDGTGARLTTATPSIYGNYYYWCELQNVTETDTGYNAATPVLVKIVDRTLEAKLMNGGFQDFLKLQIADKNGNYWEINPIVIEGLTYTNVVQGGTGSSGTRTIPVYWNTTGHYDKANLYRTIEVGGVGTYGMTTKNSNMQAGSKTSAPTVTPELDLLAELSGYVKSSLYQDIATQPGKIYEWSLDHSLKTGSNDIMAVVIGPAINVSTDYDEAGLTNYWNSGRSYYTDVCGDYSYGTNMSTLFNAVAAKFAADEGVSYPSGLDNSKYIGKSFSVKLGSINYWAPLIFTFLQFSQRCVKTKLQFACKVNVFIFN
jgi:hypothetical protein